jgi:hypothetical protein
LPAQFISFSSRTHFDDDETRSGGLQLRKLPELKIAFPLSVRRS